ncbi:hypothetical protein D3C86_1279690 [compost metagenome]
MPGVGAQGFAGHQQADQCAGPFGNHRGPGSTDHTPFQAEDEPQVQGNVDQVGAQQNRQGRPGILGAEKPADQCITGERRRQAEQAGMEELAGQLIELSRRLHEMQRDPAQRHAHRTQDHGQADGEQQALQQNLPQGGTIPTPRCLGGEPGGAHAQKAHGPGKEGVQTGPDRDGAELMGVGQVTDDGAVDQCHQRYGNVRKNHRRGECPDPAMGRAVAPVGGQVGHAGSLGAGIVAAHQEQAAINCGSGGAAIRLARESGRPVNNDSTDTPSSSERRPEQARSHRSSVVSVDDPAQQPQPQHQPDETHDERRIEKGADR